MDKKVIVGMVAAAALSGGVAAWAQTAPPAPPPAPGDGGPRPERAMDGMDRPMDPMGGPMMHREGDMRHGGWMQRFREFSLIYPARDKALSGPDVQKIAEAFLLINGNHTWKITEVTEQPDTVTFAVAVPDGTAIAHFSMDRHTARPERIS